MIRFALSFLATIAVASSSDETSVPRGCTGRGVSGPIVVATDGQIVENLVVRSTGGPAIRRSASRARAMSSCAT